MSYKSKRFRDFEQKPEKGKTKMQTTVKPENRSWPRENAKNTKKDGLILNVEVRSDSIRLKTLPRSALCALCVPLRQFDFGVRVKIFAALMLVASAGSALA